MKRSELLASLLFLASSLFLAVIMFLSISSVRVGYPVILISMLFSIATDILLLHRIQNLADELELEKEVAQSALRQKERIESYLVIQKETEQLMTDVHDIENSIYQYNSLKNQGLDQEAAQYIEDLRKTYHGLQ
ncbi:MAG: hypothetical protein K6D03_10320 [Solobacterium sp.]|nr:hypothetical protein [Solobacterium sp.]